MEKVFAYIKLVLPQRFFRAARPAYHFLLAFFAAFVYRFPSRKLVVIGVTGTKGKTTVVELLHAMLEAAGVKAASSSSLRFRIDDEEVVNDLKMTMPGRFFMQGFLRRAVHAGCRYAVLEVTSEGIAQFRHRFIDFDVAVMTNVEPEHIESHGSFEQYLRAKLDLFWRLTKYDVAVINKDDRYGARFAAATSAGKIWYLNSGISWKDREWRLVDTRMGREGIEIRFRLVRSETMRGDEYVIRSSLQGVFNLYNLLAAIATAMSIHLDMAAIGEGAARVKSVKGRMEWIQKEPFGVVVDYAHTPGSLRHAYETAKKITASTSKNLICVLGSAGGGRDRWKRPEFGKIAAEFCREIILTNEDPYDEDPASILEEIEAGFSPVPSSKFPPYAEASAGRPVPSSRKILDRREAIRAALRSAASGDVVIITGKGAEQWIMGSGGVRIPWDDRTVVREELSNDAS